VKSAATVIDLMYERVADHMNVLRLL